MKQILAFAAILAALAIPAASAAADGLGSENTVMYYQNTVMGCDTGIYEHGGLVYVLVKLPYQYGKDRKDRKRLKAVFEARSLLKQWLSEEAQKSRTEPRKLPAGYERIRTLMDEEDSSWQMVEWNLPKCPMREMIPHLKDGVFVFAQVFERKDLMKALPSVPDLSTAAVVDAAFMNSVKAHRARYELAFEKMASNADNEKISKMWETFLNQSKVAESMKENAAAISTPRVTTNWVEVVGAPERVEREEIVVSTNQVQSSEVKKNQLVETQTAEDRQYGISCGGKVTCSTETTDERIVERRKVKTIEEVSHVTIRRIVSTKAGNPVMEKMFLSGGTETPVKPMESNDFGRRALATFKAVPEDAEAAAFAGAERMLVAALQENPGDGELWRALGACYSICDEDAAAMACFREALSLRGADVATLLDLAEVCKALQVHEKSLAYAIHARALAQKREEVERAKELLDE